MGNTAYALVFGSVITLGLPLNAVALWIFLQRHSLKSPNAVFMVNLAISDLLLIISLPLRVYFFTTGTWPLGTKECVWITVFFHSNIRSSSFFITFICVDRLLAVVFPLRTRHLRTSSNAWKVAVLIWLIVLLLSIKESMEFSEFLQAYNESTCFEFQHHYKSQTVYIQPVLVSIMLVVNIVCTTVVSWTLRRHFNDSANIKNKVNVMLIFVLNFMMFVVFFLPVSWIVVSESRKSAFTPLTCLASVNCCLDPLLYYFSFDGFWKRKDDVDTTCERIVGDNKRQEQVTMNTIQTE